MTLPPNTETLSRGDLLLLVVELAQANTELQTAVTELRAEVQNLGAEIAALKRAGAPAGRALLDRPAGQEPEEIRAQTRRRHLSLPQCA